MDNYVAITFDSETQASDALHALWALDVQGEITVHGAAVIRRNELGYVQVATKQTHPGVRTAVGIGVGALLGALAGPAGAVAGAKIGAAAGIGAATGGAIGLTADAVKAGEHEEAAYESGFMLAPGQSAVLAEISESWATAVDTLARRFGGKVYRRPKDDVNSDSFFGPSYGYYFYPYDYAPYWH